jgi:cobalt-zinc-cadmium efflux system protein
MGVHDHGHNHSHGHGGRDRTNNRKRLAVTLALSAAYMLAEVVGGLVANSLALLADAAHMFTDVAALALSLVALWLAERPAGGRRTYGYYRAEILAALVNGATLVAVAIYIFVEAYRRLWEPPQVAGDLMMGVAVGGLAINLVGLRILNAGRAESLNVRGAWLHVLTDALGSVGAIAAGGLVWAFGWDWADPVASVLIGLLVIYSSLGLLRETVAVLMEDAPGHIDVDRVRDAIVAVDDVVAVHHLHIWSITSGLVALSAHVVVRGDRPHRAVLAELREALQEQFGVDHTTIQV